MKTYMKNRYHSDPTFREKVKEATIKWRLDHPEKAREYRAKYDAKRKAERQAERKKVAQA
jgi:hypothetical protein